MGTVNPQAASRERIAEAAQTEIDEKGILGLRVQDVARKAGVSVPLIYKYYGDRDGLLCEVLSRSFTETARIQMERAARILAEAGPNPTPDDVVAALMTDPHNELRACRAEMVQILAASAEIPALREYLQKAQHEIFQNSVMFLQSIFADLGLGDIVPVDGLATLLNVASFGMVMDDLLGEHAVDNARYTQMVRLIVKAFMETYSTKGA